MPINITDELHAATTKGKIASAKEVFLTGDIENLQQIGEKTHQLEDSIKNIAVTGGASTAAAVTFDNVASGMTAVNAQAAIEELNTKNKTQDTEIAKKANSDDVDTKINKEKARVNGELEKKIAKDDITQELGESEEKVVSQKIVKTSIDSIYKKIDEVTVKITEETIVYGYLEINNTWKTAVTEANLKINQSLIIPVTGGNVYEVLRKNNACLIAFFKSLPDTWTNGMSMTDYYATGGSRFMLPVSIKKDNVPSDAKYLMVTLKVNDADWSPSILKVGGYDYLKNVCANIIEDKKNIVNIVASIKKGTSLYYDQQFTLSELYVAAAVCTEEQINSITKGSFYNKYVNNGQYAVGLILRDNSNNTIIDGRIYFTDSDKADKVLKSGVIELPNIKYVFDCTKTSAGVVKEIPLNLDKTVSDISNSPKLQRSAINFCVDKTENIIEASIKSTGYIDENGEYKPSSRMFYTTPIHLNNNDVIRVYANGNVSAVISKTDVDGEKYKPLIISIGSMMSLYEYKADTECYVSISYVAKSGLKASVICSENITFDATLDFEVNKFVTLTGYITGTTSAYGISKPIRIYKGDVLSLSISATANLVAVMSLSDNSGLVLKPIISTSSDAYLTYTYNVRESGYVVVSGNTASVKPPKLTITRAKSKSDFEELLNDVTSDSNFANNKHFYSESCKYIPEAYNTIFTYDVDSKVSTNHITNAVAYPDGTIIACRQNNVVKIAKDGTEKTLLTIANSWDWRGMFIDSNNNVYVSPHNTLSSISLSMADRGLYKLPYGGDTFTKVISLYNTESLIQTETQENDDTIWTMCEDSKGNLYAGVYAHSIRANPSIYRSSDGGNTWLMVCNMLDKGYVVSGDKRGKPMHIHCITYNQYNNALYCLVGEVNSIYKSTDLGITWQDLNVYVENAKGTTIIAVPDGMLIGSDGITEGVISKLYVDDKTIRTVGKMWHAEFFAMRKSDITGYIYGFTKIESSINKADKYPPITANTDSSVLDSWKSSASSGKVKSWEQYNQFVAQYYTHDSIHPTNAAIVVSRDNGESWEVIYKKDTNSSRDIGMGIFCVGYFRNGECLCGIAVENEGKQNFTNPVVISEGPCQYNSDGIDVSGKIFGKIF